MTTRPLERYPAAGNPLPVAWGGKEVKWDEWAEATTFTGARALKKSHTACDRCQTDPQSDSCAPWSRKRGGTAPHAATMPKLRRRHRGRLGQRRMGPRRIRLQARWVDPGRKPTAETSNLTDLEAQVLTIERELLDYGDAKNDTPHPGSGISPIQYFQALNLFIGSPRVRVGERWIADRLRRVRDRNAGGIGT